LDVEDLDVGDDADLLRKCPAAASERRPPSRSALRPDSLRLEMMRAAR
jgi:hypothetical protein